MQISNDFNASDTLVVGRTNTIEIWIANDATLTGMSSYLEFEFTGSLSWVMDGGQAKVSQFGRALGTATDGSCWTQGGFAVSGDFDGDNPDRIVFGGAAIPPDGLAAGESDLCYSLSLNVPEGAEPLESGFCLTFTSQPPGEGFPFSDPGSYAPTFCGLEFGSTICFDVAALEFINGDANRDGMANVTDAIYIINFIFQDGEPPHPYEAGDASCDGLVNITDAVYLVQYVFNQGPEPGCHE